MLSLLPGSSLTVKTKMRKFTNKPKSKSMRKWKLLSLIMFVTLGMITSNLMAQDVPISGTVLSENGTPVPGVTVTVVGTNKATVTDMQGKFTITAKEGAML